MKDGLDRAAFAAELRSLDPGERRQRTRELGQWLRAAARAAGWHANIGLFLVSAAPAMAFFGFKLRLESYVLVPLAIAFLVVGSCLNVSSGRRARAWRHAHPFEQWRGARQKLS